MLSTYALQTMVDTLPIAACVFIGPELVIAAANEQMLATWNKDRSVIGAQLLTGIPEIHDQGYSELLTKVYQTGEQYRDPDGEAMLVVNGELQPVYFEFSLKPLRDHDGNIYGVVNTAVDTSERVKATSQLEQAIEELAATNEELSALNEEYMTINEELEAGSEELRATNEELCHTKEQLERSVIELADSEERLLMAADAVKMGMFDLEVLTGQLVTSKRFDSIFGLEAPADVQTYQLAIHPDDAEIRERAMQEAMITGGLRYEVRVIRPDRTEVWIRAEGKVIFDAAGKPLRIIGTLMDFTEEQHEKEVQRKLKALADNSADLMSLLNLDGKNSYINTAGKTLLGFETEEQVLNTPIAQLHTPEDLAQVQTEVLPAVMTEGIWAGTMRVRHLKTGEVFPVLNYTVRIDDPVTGKPVGIGAIMRDLRPELAGKKALADSEQMLQNLTSAAPTALWMADQNGRLTYVNQRWIEWTGLSFDRSLGSGWLNAVMPDERSHIREKYLSALAERASFEMEFRILNAEKQVRWLCASGHPQFDIDHKFSGFVGACTDITSQKELQQHKDDFISIASHELKTPITSLKAVVQLLNKIRINTDNPMVPKLLTQAGKSVERVGVLIDDLLNVSKLQQQELKLNKAEFILSELFNACANPIALAGKQKITITGDLEARVYADEHRIDQVVTNLLTNATKYAPDSDLIEMIISKGHGQVRVTVTDYGQGIPSDRLKKLFERYYRVNDTIQHVSGLGLGLYICAEIIHRHGGQIGAESELGKGSTFWFTLPH